MKKAISTVLAFCLCMMFAVLSGCGGTSSQQPTETATATEAATADEAKNAGIDYMALVNKTHKLPDDWEENLQTVHMTNSIGYR